MCFGGGGEAATVDFGPAVNAIMSGQAPAIEALKQAQDSGIYYLERMFDKAEGIMEPYTTAGKGATQQLSDIFLGKGTDLADIPAFSSLTDTLAKYGLRGLDRSASAKGLDLSGAHMKGLTNWMQDLALTKSVQPYLQGLQGLYTGGLNAATNLAGWGMGTGNTAAGLYGNTGAKMAGVYTDTGKNVGSLLADQAKYNAAAETYNNQQSGSWVNDLMSGLGFAGSLALAPFTGGTSLAGAGMSGLKGLFGGGGSTGSLYSPSLIGTSNAYGPGLIGRAKGGPVRKRRPYIVGERGPEVFIPDEDGMILPNNVLSGLRKVSGW